MIMQLRGRKRIYTDEREITAENIVKVLRSAYTAHQANVREIQYLLDYEIGIQPLPREKTIRPDKLHRDRECSKFRHGIQDGILLGHTASDDTAWR